MKFASKIKSHTFTWGGTLFTAPFPSHGEVSIIGSFAGGAQLARVLSKHLSADVVADTHAGMLLEGSKKRDKNAIKIFLDSIGASLSFSADKDRLVFSGRVRSVSADKLLTLIEEVLTTPTFPAAELAVFKKRLATEFSLEAQNPHAQAVINLSHSLFDNKHPNRQDSTDVSKSTAQKITRNDLVTYHEQSIDVRTLRIAIAGSITEKVAKSLVQKHFARLPQNNLKTEPFEISRPTVAQQTVSTISDKASIDYMFGIATGITKDHPDYPALVLGLQVLGVPGFTGRLMSTVREIEGLTYAVYAYPAGFSNSDGYCVISASFAPELFAKGRAAVIREVQRIVEKGITEIELKRNAHMYDARTRIACANSSDLARAAHIIASENRKPTYLDEFPQRILRLTRKEVNNVLKKYLTLDNMSESAAGPLTKDDLLK